MPLEQSVGGAEFVEDLFARHHFRAALGRRARAFNIDPCRP
jgi:hypothetical protein